MAQLPFISTTVDETEDNIVTGDARLHMVVATNPGNAIAYLKIWAGVAADINPATDVATIALIGVPSLTTVVTWLGDVHAPAGACIGATTQPGVGAGAPNAEFAVTLYYN